MPKIDIKEFICRPFCRFFREGEKEDMECMGAVVIEGLIKRKKLYIDDIPTDGKEKDLWEGRIPLLENHVCSRCEFRIGGCDYMADNPPSDAEPCGGNILLVLLLKRNILSDQDIKNTDD